MSPLQYSFLSNSEEMFNLLIKEANQFTKDDLLIQATEREQIKMIEMLLDNEANAEARNVDKNRLNAASWLFGPHLTNEIVGRSCLEIALKDNIDLFKMINYLK